MKKYMIYAFAACMTIVGAGCSKDFEDADAQQTPVVEGKYRLPSLSASLDDETAATRTGEPNATTGAVNWTAKDRILIVRISDTDPWETWQYELVKGASSSIGEFEPAIGGTGEASSNKEDFSDLIAVYPVSAAYVDKANKKLSFKINQNWYPEDEAEKAALKERLEGMGIKTWNKDTQFSFKENDIKVSYKCTPTATEGKVTSANFKFRQLGAWCKFEFDFSTDETYSQEKLLRIAVSTVDGATKFTGTADVDLSDRNNPTLTSSGDGTSIDWTFANGSNMTTAFSRSLMLYPCELTNQRLKIVAETNLHTFTFYATPKQALKAGTVFHFPISLGFQSFGENDVDAAASKDLAYTVTDKAQIPFYYYGGTNCYLAIKGETDPENKVTVKCTPYKTDAYFHNTGTKVSDETLGAEYTPTDAKLIWYESALGEAPTIGTYDATNDSFTVTMPSDKYGNALVGVYNAAGKILWSYHIWAPEVDPRTGLLTYANTKSGSYDVMPMALGATKVAVPNETPNANRIDGAGLWYQWGRKDPMGRIARWTGRYTVAVTTVADPTNEINAVAEAAEGTGTFFRNAAYDETVAKENMNVLYLRQELLAGGYTDDITATALDRTEVEKIIDDETGATVKVSVDRYMIDQAIANPTRFIAVSTYYNDWVGQPNNYLWGNPKGYEYPRISQTYKSIFDPCPDGYRVPPKDLWINFTATGANTNYIWELNVKGQYGVGQTDNTAFRKGFELYYEGMGESVINESGTSGTYAEPENGKTDFYIAAAYREYDSGNIGGNEGKEGFYWSSSPSNSYSSDSGYLRFASSPSLVYPLNNYSRARSFTVRCIKAK